MTPQEAAYLLDLPVDSDRERIEAARKREARLWHPDRQSDPEVAKFASDRMSRINQAADLLIRDRDSSSRDEARRPRQTTTAAPPSATRTDSRTEADVLVRAGGIGIAVLAITVTVLAPFMSLEATYGVALVVGVAAGLAAFVRSATRRNRHIE